MRCWNGSTGGNLKQNSLLFRLCQTENQGCGGWAVNWAQSSNQTPEQGEWVSSAGSTSPPDLLRRLFLLSFSINQPQPLASSVETRIHFHWLKAAFSLPGRVRWRHCEESTAWCSFNASLNHDRNSSSNCNLLYFPPSTRLILNSFEVNEAAVQRFKQPPFSISPPLCSHPHLFFFFVFFKLMVSFLSTSRILDSPA